MYPWPQGLARQRNPALAGGDVELDHLRSSPGWGNPIVDRDPRSRIPGALRPLQRKELEPAAGDALGRGRSP